MARALMVVVSLCIAVGVSLGSALARPAGLLPSQRATRATTHRTAVKHRARHTHHYRRARSAGPKSSVLRHGPRHVRRGRPKLGGADPVLFGDQTIEATSETAPAGLADAFPFNDQITGTAASISVYVDSSNRASKLIAGLYSDKRGRPGSLLATGSLSLPAAGAWNTMSVNSTSISAGRSYWIAFLGSGGALSFRDLSSGPCTSVASSKTNLISLPGSWSTGSQSSRCPASAYVSGYEAAPWNTVLPTIAGQPVEGQVLSASTGSWGNPPSSYAYQWQDCTSSGCTNIAGATSSAYTLQASDVGDNADVVVTASDAGGSASATSVQTATVADVASSSAPTDTVLPTISGSAIQGQTLTASPGTWTNSPTSYAYKWQDCDSSGSNCTPIAGTTTSTYMVVAADVGHTIRVAVTASNATGSTSGSSAPTAVVTSGTASLSDRILMTAASTGTTTAFGTFSSQHEAAVYVPGDGTFVAWLAYDPSNEVGCSQDPPATWHNPNVTCNSEVRVAQSTDDGTTWTVRLDLQVGGHYPPSLAVDNAGNVYALIDSDGLSYSFLYELPAGNYGSPTIIARPPCGEAGGKFATEYDPAADGGQGAIYEVKGHYDTPCDGVDVFRLINVNATTHAVKYLDMVKGATLNGTDTVIPHYPQMYVARDGSGLTVLAWTNTDRTVNTYGYYDIHYLVSPDHGSTWYGPCGIIGQGSCDAFPISTLSATDSWELLSSSEYATPSTAYNWLESVYIQDDHVFFVDCCGNSGLTDNEQYRRVTWNPSTHSITADQGPTTLTQFHNFSGFFSGTGTASAPIYFSSGSGGQPLTLRTTDGGAAWNTYATGASCSCSMYAIAGARMLGPNGDVLGAFTNNNNDDVWFFHTAFS